MSFSIAFHHSAAEQIPELKLMRSMPFITASTALRLREPAHHHSHVSPKWPQNTGRSRSAREVIQRLYQASEKDLLSSCCRSSPYSALSSMIDLDNFIINASLESAVTLQLSTAQGYMLRIYLTSLQGRPQQNSSRKNVHLLADHSHLSSPSMSHHELRIRSRGDG